ncbi:hypothetical protein NLG97_g9364 [Lecanicillium saksenae]|uniref:Uncharacterized protein n=1 Tax=Lecanicillium saksenae TaxID=468837 RepID=A0ACC1QG77_9HYPO|nr:hypothetical protein NLG97_g9364 [Lecanicillium saksenae]
METIAPLWKMPVWPRKTPRQNVASQDLIYDELPASDTGVIGDGTQVCHPNNTAQQLWILWGAVFTVCCLAITVSLWVFAPMGQKQPVINQDAAKTANCGNSSESALTAGCKFDMISFTWSHPDCFDEELMAEFLSLKNWTWWFDTAGEHPVPLDKVATGTHANLYVTWEYHTMHCTFMWKKMHRAMLQQRPLDLYVGNLNHTMHCEKVLLSRIIDLEDKTTLIQIKYPDCPLQIHYKRQTER